jgi:hypothetical protein
MSGKISGLSGTPAPVGAGRRADKPRDASSGGAAAAGSAGSGDVQITSSASLLASLEQQLHTMPAVNEQPQHVADQLLQMEHSLAQISGG